MTERVRADGDPVGMDATTPNTLETCSAVMIGLGGRRFVIVRRGDEPTGLRRVADGPARVRDLLPGDEVIHKGQRMLVRSVEIYEA